MGPFYHAVPHLPVQGLSFRDTRIFGDSQLSELGIQITGHILDNLGGGSRLTIAIENARRPFLRRLLPFVDQYAISVRKRLNGVRSSMRMSSQIDQFSM